MEKLSVSFLLSNTQFHLKYQFQPNIFYNILIQ